MAPVELLGKANVRCVGMQYVGRWDTNDAVNDFLETLASNAVCGEYGSVALRGAPNENDATGMLRASSLCAFAWGIHTIVAAVEAFETKSRARLGFIQRDAARLLFPHLSGVSRIVVECRITHCLVRTRCRPLLSY